MENNNIVQKIYTLEEKGARGITRIYGFSEFRQFGTLLGLRDCKWKRDVFCLQKLFNNYM